MPEQTKVIELSRYLASEGVAVIDITHNTDDVMRISDRIAVMHRGCKAGELITCHTTQSDIVHAIMSGKI